MGFSFAATSWAMAVQEESRRPAYYAGYMLGIVLIIYFCSRLFTGVKRQGLGFLG
jgi:hypothetical protein